MALKCYSYLFIPTRGLKKNVTTAEKWIHQKFTIPVQNRLQCGINKKSYYYFTDNWNWWTHLLQQQPCLQALDPSALSQLVHKLETAQLDKNNNRLSLYSSLLAYQARAYPSFPLTWSDLWNGVEWDITRLKCFVQKQNTLTWPGPKPGPLDTECSVSLTDKSNINAITIIWKKAN